MDTHMESLWNALTPLQLYTAALGLLLTVGYIIYRMASQASKGSNGKKWPVVPGSKDSHACINEVRSCVEIYFADTLKKIDKKDLLDLSIGDPSKFGNLPPHPAVREAIVKVTQGGLYEGYAHSSGLEITRKAVAEMFSCEEAPLTHEDVVMACACSGACELAITVLSNPGQNILCPMPGFAIYKCLTESRGVEARLYRLKPDKSWEVDLEHLESLIDSNTAAIVVTNPSNPCGSVFSREHLKEIVALAEKYHLPIIADEIYAWMVFRGQTFHSVASVSQNVPVLSCGGTAKRFMIPGWRIGWVLIHDRHDAFKSEVVPGLARLAMKLLGPCTLVQAALPDIIRNVPASWHQEKIDFFEKNATMCYDCLTKVPGLKPVMPSGAMYMMVVIELEHFPEFEDDVAFTKQMVLEQKVFCLPGLAFHTVKCFRVVLVMPIDKIEAGCGRIETFCRQHYKP